MMRIIKQIIIRLCIAFLLFGCASTARLYNVETLEVIYLDFKISVSGHGKITGKLPNGKELAGEYSSLSEGSTSAGSVGSEGYEWAITQGFSFNQPDVQYGSATLVGDGLVIEIVYAALKWTSHGSGVGRDNQGGRYRVRF